MKGSTHRDGSSLVLWTRGEQSLISTWSRRPLSCLSLEWYVTFWSHHYCPSSIPYWLISIPYYTVTVSTSFVVDCPHLTFTTQIENLQYCILLSPLSWFHTTLVPVPCHHRPSSMPPLVPVPYHLVFWFHHFRCWMITMLDCFRVTWRSITQWNTTWKCIPHTWQPHNQLRYVGAESCSLACS